MFRSFGAAGSASGYARLLLSKSRAVFSALSFSGLFSMSAGASARKRQFGALSVLVALCSLAMPSQAAVSGAQEARLAAVDSVSSLLQLQQVDRHKQGLVNKQLQATVEELTDWQQRPALPAPVVSSLQQFLGLMEESRKQFSLAQVQRLMNGWRQLDELLAAMEVNNQSQLDQALAKMDVAFAMQNLGYLLQEWPALAGHLPEADVAAMVQRDSLIRSELRELETLLPGERLLEKLKSRYALVSAKVLEPADNYSPPLVMFFTSSMRDMLDKIAFRAQLRGLNA